VAAGGTAGQVLTKTSATDYATAWTTLGTWQLYTPGFSATGSPPSLGNGTLAGAYTVIGKTCWFKIQFQYQSATVPGSGVWLFGLPLAAAASPVNDKIGQAYAGDYGVAAYIGIAVQYGTTGVYAEVGNAQQIGPTTPFAWNVNDFLSFTGFYQIA